MFLWKSHKKAINPFLWLFLYESKLSPHENFKENCYVCILSKKFKL